MPDDEDTVIYSRCCNVPTIWEDCDLLELPSLERHAECYMTLCPCGKIQDRDCEDFHV